MHPIRGVLHIFGKYPGFLYESDLVHFYGRAGCVHTARIA